MHRVLTWAGQSAGLAVIPPAAHADPVLTPLLTVNCFGFGVCAPRIPITQMVETAPGQFVGVMQYGVMYALSPSGSFAQGYVINDTNNWNSTPLLASDGNLYVPSSAGTADIVKFNTGLTFLATFLHRPTSMQVRWSRRPTRFCMAPACPASRPPAPASRSTSTARSRACRRTWRSARCS